MQTVTQEQKIALLESYPYDVIATKEGKQIYIFFFNHASLCFLIDNYVIYYDPVTDFADYESLPKADLVLVTHSHYDHLDIEAINKIKQDSTLIISDKTSADMLAEAGLEATAMRPAAKMSVNELIEIEAVAAYNTSNGHTDFHPQNREDCGYLLTVNGARIYLSGDGEPTTEMLALKDIDIAFLSVNQPYTMTVEQATDTVKALRPAIFYPYHYGQVEIKTNIAQLCYNLQNVTEVRIRPLE